MPESAGLRWTGNPVIDMGAAAVTLAAGTELPEEVTLQQWHDVMQQLEQDYVDGLFKKPSMILLTNNSFENPSFSKKPEARAQKIRETFALARGEVAPLEELCTFLFDRPAVVRAARDQMPLLQGQNQINFYPNGQSEIALSGLALGCILALPLVSPVVSGRLMVIAADDADLFLDLCWGWYQELKSDRAWLRLDGTVIERKAPRSRFLERLGELYAEPRKQRRKQSDLKSYVGITLYHLSNSGNAPFVNIYIVPPHVTGFFHRAQGGEYKPRWNALVKTFWRNAKGKLVGAEPPEDERRLSKNSLYEDLFSLPYEADRFIRKYFQRVVFNRVGIRDNLTVQDLDLWPLLELFLMEVMHMQQERIDKIRTIADELAREIKENNDKSLYRKLMGRTGGRDAYAAFRQLLIHATRERLRREDKLLLTLDDYLLVFEEGKEFPRADWRLARDLVRLRCLEMLHQMGYFAEEPELLEEEEEEAESEIVDL